MDFFVKTKKIARAFSVNVELEFKWLKCSILEDLKSGRWPTDCLIKRKGIKNYIHIIQNQILICKREQQFNLVTSNVFDIRNRIFAIDSIFTKFKARGFIQFYHNSITLKTYKFILLLKTKLSNILKLLLYKVIINKKSFSKFMLVDKVLQFMFFTFLDVIVEEKLKPEVFGYRKGRDARMTVAALYYLLKRVKYKKKIYLSLIEIKKSFNKVKYEKILEQYPFPKSYSYLLIRWLTLNLINKNQSVFQEFFIKMSVLNLMLSYSLPEKVFKQNEKKKQPFWIKFFFYVNNFIIVSNNILVFQIQLISLKKNLKKIGLIINYKKTKSFIDIRNRINFNFLGFKFIIIPLKLMKKKKFVIFLRPHQKIIKNIKNWLKLFTKKILHQSYHKIYKYFQQINFLLLKWGCYYYFSQGCEYGKKIDNYVFQYLKKILIKKFRYNGLLRPKWVSYNFLGLHKINPNGRKWQLQTLWYVKNLSKTVIYFYIWNCSDFFLKLSMSFFLLNRKLCNKNYYAFKNDFDKNTNKLFLKRLKFKFYVKQNSLWFMYKKLINKKFY